MQFQLQYTPISTSTVMTSATAVLISATTQQRGYTKVEIPMTLVIDSISGGSLGSAGVAVLSASGTVVHRHMFATGGGYSTPTHIILNQGESLEGFASGSAGALNILFHRQ